MIFLVFYQNTTEIASNNQKKHVILSTITILKRLKWNIINELLAKNLKRLYSYAVKTAYK